MYLRIFIINKLIGSESFTIRNVILDNPKFPKFTGHDLSMIRFFLIGYLYGITSERRLCQEVHLNIAYRWFCGLSLKDKVPHHSSFSKNRNGRFAQTDLFRKLFNEIVKQAQEKGLIKSKYWSTDAT